jgi:hypothetical protein
MELRIDRLLASLRQRPADVLAAIDRDPMLLKRENGGLVLANASQELYTPQHEHQLYAKGIVYRRDPYELVSLPLLKIYNLGERDVTAHDLAALSAEPGVRLRFLRKIDGSLIQVFRHAGRAWITTRGMIEGGRAHSDPEAGEGIEFDYLGAARRIAAARYPALLADEELLHGRTLIFELIHPRARKVTDYGSRDDLILLACFDHRRFAYWPYPEVADLGLRHSLTMVDALTPAGAGVAEQIDNLLAALAGTDEEGSVLHFERDAEVVYRVKVKSPDYLRLMRLLAECTYARTVELLDENPQLKTWEDFAAFLRAQGNERVPEEVLDFYRQHRERYLAYLADCDRLQHWAEQACADLEARLGGRVGKPPAAFRKAFAALATGLPFAGLIFSALDGRLDRARVRRLVATPEQVHEALEAIAGEGHARTPSPTS